MVTLPFASPKWGVQRSTPATIEGLRDAIAKYENRIEETVQTAAQAGIYWKILAIRYMDRRMYSESLEAFERAVSYFPEDPSLFYYSGLCAGIVAKSSLDFGASGRNLSRDKYYALAEASQLRAISLDPAYARPRYALGVLYVFELGRPEDAITHLETYLELESKSLDGMFVLARAYFMTGAFQKAVDVYDRIISITRDPSRKVEAESNKKAALDALYD
ncbi:tetratricopeptide repeat protein [Treponema sp.]